MSIIVQKYGGTSVGNVEKIKSVARRIIRAKEKGNQVAVIVSAMGHATDELISLIHQLTDSPDPREYDMVVSTGEQVSAGLLAIAIQNLGYKAISLTGFQAGVLTEPKHRKARITGMRVDRVKKELDEDKIVIVTGFQGITQSEDIATIGRGGSDTSAVVMAAALQADVCEIFTDVNGVYTADPRIVLDARKLDVISYEEMLELASLGAQVLHPRAVEAAKEHKVVIHVRSSIEEEEGTLVKEVSKMERKDAVSGVAADTNVAKIGMLQVPDRPGIAAKLFSALSRENINVDMIIQSIHGGKVADIAFTVSHDDLKKTEETVRKIAEELGAAGVVLDKNVAKVSIVGVGMISQPGVAAAMFQALADEKVNIEMISTSEIKVSCVIGAEHVKKAVAALHRKFGLDKK